MMDAPLFLTTPRRRRTVGTSDLARYSRLEHGTPDPTWIVADRAKEDREPVKALKRWLLGDDRALEEGLGGPPPERARKTETIG